MELWVDVAMVQLPVERSRSINSILDASAEPVERDQDEPNWDILCEEWLSDEPELESDFHRDQIDLLLRLMKWVWRDRNDIYCSGNTTVYYDEFQRTNRNFRGPDLYVVLGAESRSRNSWMIWREGGKYPNLVIELLSNSTAKVDRTTKKELYQDVWRLPNYFWFHPVTKEFKGFRLVDGLYVELVANRAGQLWCEELGMFLGLQDGVLRLFSADGSLVMGQDEEAALRADRAEGELMEERNRANEERDRANEERDRANEERDRADRLAARLRELGLEA
jgi:Uma2 family endonuclease